ncbi:hypothetical protein FHS27_000955 [Rhodopirellula rubra]|uniref:Uncharacterized protein n=1 Tax=Aporhodopirellula rubra TaxID=980271 RepID=A0A7W5DVB0_9BACT|nr:hypothetical protein [Aporhodopirellula rubra]
MRSRILDQCAADDALFAMRDLHARFRRVTPTKQIRWFDCLEAMPNTGQHELLTNQIEFQNPAAAIG